MLSELGEGDKKEEEVICQLKSVLVNEGFARALIILLSKHMATLALLGK